MAKISAFAQTPRTKPPAYTDVDRLTNAHGIVAVISQKSRDGSLTFGMHREFERDGRMDRGTFVPEHLGDAYLELVTQTLARMKKIREDEQALIASGKPGVLPYVIRTRLRTS